MANEEHLEIMLQGVEVWNQWRNDNPKITPDLTYANFKGRDFSRANLKWAMFAYANLSGADLSEANLRKVDFSSANLSQANFSKANLSEAIFTLVDLNRANLSKANLRKANLSGVDLNGANLNGADLNGADLSRTILRGATLRVAILSNANLRNADFRNADLSEAILVSVDFSYVIADNLNLSQTVLGLTRFCDNNLSQVIGLDSVKHQAPSSIGIDTLYRSGGNIPEIFLRGCGLPKSFITQIPALIASVEPIQFYKCFISFTETDDAFSERLYNDLQAAGVRCWRWKEDAKWGRTLIRSIDEAVHVYDKLVVICSEASLNSPAVVREIERALQKEDDIARKGRDNEVLFPIRLDDFVFAEWQHYRKADLIAKNVGDFRKWKNHDDYKKAFDRLLRDLKAE
jgi:uncharacterized protein YjbI with pentapeptide repeats